MGHREGEDQPSASPASQWPFLHPQSLSGWITGPYAMIYPLNRSKLCCIRGIAHVRHLLQQHLTPLNKSTPKNPPKPLRKEIDLLSRALLRHFLARD